MTRRSVGRSDSKKRSRQAIDLQRVVIAAADAVGSDGHGQDGLDGYMMYLARKQPRVFGAAIVRALSLEVEMPKRYALDLTKLSDEELAQLEHIIMKAQVVVDDEDDTL